MKWFYDMKIGPRLFLAFGILAFIFIALGLYSIYALNIVNNQSTIINQLWLPGIVHANAANTMTSDFRILEYEHVLANDKTEMGNLENELTAKNNEIQKELKAYDDGRMNPAERRLYAQVVNQWNRYLEVHKNVLLLSSQLQTGEAMKLMQGSAKRAFNLVSDALLELVDYNRKSADAADQAGNQIFSSSRNILILVIVILLVITITASLLIINSIVQPVKTLNEAATKLSLGDVNISVDAKTRDEVGELMAAFNKMVANIREQAYTTEQIAAGDLTVTVNVKSENDLLGLKLREMIEKNNEVLSNINGAATQVSVGSKQVSLSSQNLSQGSTEQASSLEEITASITEVAAQTKQNASNANQANKLAVDAKDSAIEGNQQMKAMLSAMAEINDSSANISKIIKVIDEIAFQTNILALNAAVEAARAGQHGKGFAVVAEEVRNLAARSADAAKETTTMIEGSIKKVEVGTKIANETAAALNKIVEGVSGATNLVAEIAAASNQQASAVSQINQGIEQIAQVTQSNTATAEESAAASEELSGQAELLKDMVARFKIKNTGPPLSQLGNLNPDLIAALGEILDKKKAASHSGQNVLPEIAAAAANSKIKINLEDREFGKY